MVALRFAFRSFAITPPLTLITLIACSSEHPGTGAESQAAPVVAVPAAKPNAWCAAVPGLTADPSGDLTGRANDRARVERIRAAHQLDAALFRCPGVVGVGLSTDLIMKHLAAGDFDTSTWRPKVSTEHDADWVLYVDVLDEAKMPQKNPLYLDGVRVYFQVTGPIEPL